MRGAPDLLRRMRHLPFDDERARGGRGFGHWSHPCTKLITPQLWILAVTEGCERGQVLAPQGGARKAMGAVSSAPHPNPLAASGAGE
jgi:hypothetical protein